MKEEAPSVRAVLMAGLLAFVGVTTWLVTLPVALLVAALSSTPPEAPRPPLAEPSISGVS